jgi:AcrR family transcriptional regulator
LVSVKAWDYAQFERLLDEFLGSRDPDDPKTIKRTRILEAATELFLQHGYRKTSISEVAARAGVAKGTVYLYFKNKPELLVYGIAEEKGRYIESLRPILSTEIPPRGRLKEWIKMVFVVGSQMPLVSKVLSGDREILNALYDYMDAHQEQNLEALQEAFIIHMVSDAVGPHCLTDTELEDRAKVLLGTVYFSMAIADPRIRRGLSLERFADLFATMIVDGIGATGGATARPRDEEV